MISLLERPVLVLNRFWQPVHTCSVRRSLHLLCIGHAQVVQVEGEQRYDTHDLMSWIGYSNAIMHENGLADESWSHFLQSTTSEARLSA